VVAEVHLDLAEPGSDDERLEELTLRLAEELRELDVESVVPATDDDVPEGARSALAAVAGALLVAVHPTARQLLSVVGVVHDWLRRSPVQRTVKVTIDGDTLELSGTSDEVQRRVVEDWIAKHATG
jgi:hypothetical protein